MNLSGSLPVQPLITPDFSYTTITLHDGNPKLTILVCAIFVFFFHKLLYYLHVCITLSIAFIHK